MTAEWIASEFRRMGLGGGAENGSFIQRYPLNSIVVDRGASSLVAGSVRLADERVRTVAADHQDDVHVWVVAVRLPTKDAVRG